MYLIYETVALMNDKYNEWYYINNKDIDNISDEDIRVGDVTVVLNFYDNDRKSMDANKMIKGYTCMAVAKNYLDRRVKEISS